jgi:predicted CxxxxCH...CXXCH cytochrome family protein
MAQNVDASNSMQSRAFLSATLVILGLNGLACGSSRTIGETGGQVVAKCTGCHGGQDNLTGAPPFDTSGRSDPSLPSVGAHTAHVQAGALAGAFDCEACHPAWAPGHGDGTVRMSFGALSSANGTVTPSYDTQRASCSATYCHGAFPAGNPWFIPFWTKGSSQAACGTCHGDVTATATALPRVHLLLAGGATNATCNVCHPATVKADGTVDAAGGKHVNGATDVDPAAVHPATWMTAPMTSPGFHGTQASVACFRCHSADAPARVTTVYCNYCHNGLGAPIHEP